MLTIARLFGRSPFSPLQTHMDKVAKCMSELPALFAAILSGDAEAISLISQRLSEFEHEADRIKNDIRNHLPKSLFLLVDRGSLLEILALQDSLSDQAERLGLVATFKTLDFPDVMKSSFLQLCEQTMELFWLTRQVLSELDELIESSFGGIEAEKVKGMVEQIAFREYENSKLRIALLKQLYQKGDTLSVSSFHLIHALIEEVGSLSSISEKLANRIRMLLELK